MFDWMWIKCFPNREKMFDWMWIKCFPNHEKMFDWTGIKYFPNLEKAYPAEIAGKALFPSQRKLLNKKSFFLRKMKKNIKNFFFSFRFGRIPALKTIKPVKKGEELFSHYKVSSPFKLQFLQLKFFVGPFWKRLFEWDISKAIFYSARCQILTDWFGFSSKYA
jgi:hypothetical protein